MQAFRACLFIGNLKLRILQNSIGKSVIESDHVSPSSKGEISTMKKSEMSQVSPILGLSLTIIFSLERLLAP